MPRSITEGTTVDKKLSALRAETALVDQRLAELDTKLSAWIDALQQLGGRNGDGAVQAAATATASDSHQAKSVAKPEAAGASNDEALLSSLDTETANAIRVRRRLSKDKRDVRELLEELRAARQRGANDDPQQPRKRWWRRRHD
jgi:hypothetical protein